MCHQPVIRVLCIAGDCNIIARSDALILYYTRVPRRRAIGRNVYNQKKLKNSYNKRLRSAFMACTKLLKYSTIRKFKA